MADGGAFERLKSGITRAQSEFSRIRGQSPNFLDRVENSPLNPHVSRRTFEKGAVVATGVVGAAFVAHKLGVGEANIARAQDVLPSEFASNALNAETDFNLTGSDIYLFADDDIFDVMTDEARRMITSRVEALHSIPVNDKRLCIDGTLVEDISGHEGQITPFGYAGRMPWNPAVNSDYVFISARTGGAVELGENSNGKQYAAIFQIIVPSRNATYYWLEKMSETSDLRPFTTSTREGTQIPLDSWGGDLSAIASIIEGQNIQTVADHCDTINSIALDSQGNVLGAEVIMIVGDNGERYLDGDIPRIGGHVIDALQDPSSVYTPAISSSTDATPGPTDSNIVSGQNVNMNYQGMIVARTS